MSTNNAPNSFDYLRGQALYNVYCNQVGWETYLGAPIPPFEEIPDKQRNAWIYAANYNFGEDEKQL